MSTGAVSRLRAIVVVLVLAVVAAACSPDDDQVAENPTEALRDAFTALGDLEGVELVLRLEADEEVLAALTEGDLDVDEAALVLDSSLLVRAVGEGDDGSAEFVLTVAGDDVAELRVLPATDVYARIDLEALLALADDPDVSATLDAFVAQAELFGFGEVAAAVQAGEWIHLTGLEQMLQMVEGMAGEQQPDDLEDEEAERLAEEIAAAAERFLAEDVEVEYVGSEDAGERVRATTDGAALGRFLADVTSVVAATDLLDGMGGAELARELERELGGVTIAFDAWIADGELTQLALDLAGFADQDPGGEVLLVLEISEFTDAVEAPADATEIDLFGMLGGLLGGFGPPGDDPFGDDTVEDVPGEDRGDDLGEAECITEEELEQVEELMGEDALEEIQELIDAGFLEMC